MNSLIKSQSLINSMPVKRESFNLSNAIGKAMLVLPDGRVMFVSTSSASGPHPVAYYNPITDEYLITEQSWNLPGLSGTQRLGKVLFNSTDNLVHYISTAGLHTFNTLTGEVQILELAGNPVTSFYVCDEMPNGNIFITGFGTTGAGIIDKESLIYTPVANRPISTYDAGCVALRDGRIWVGGGAGTQLSTTIVATCHTYSPVSNTWSVSPALPLTIGRFKHTLTGDGDILVHGGYSAYTNPIVFNSKIYVYVVSSGIWLEVADWVQDMGRAFTVKSGQVFLSTTLASAGSLITSFDVSSGRFLSFWKP